MRQRKAKVLANDLEWLKKKCHTAEGPYLLPFAPNKHWLETSVFIVGFNPITSFRDEFESFDHYWQTLTDSPERYAVAHYAKYQKKEIDRSRTSKRLNELVDYLMPVNVLITNVFAYPATNPKLIPQKVRCEPIEDRILSHLINLCKPKVLFFHGTEARQYAKKFFRTELNPYLPPEEQNTFAFIPGANSPSLLLAYHHLVGRVERKSATDKHLKLFAERIRSHV
jgi:hypothetical protein